VGQVASRDITTAQNFVVITSQLNIKLIQKLQLNLPNYSVSPQGD